METSTGHRRKIFYNPYAYIILTIGLVLLYALLVYLNIVPQSNIIAQNPGIIETHLAESAFALLFGIAIIEAVSRAIYYYMIKGINRAEARTLSELFKVVAYSLLALTILTIIVGIQNISGILVGAGFLGIVIGLAAQSTISNLISGVYLLASRTLEPGDYVNIHTWQYTMQPETYPHDKFIPGFSGTIESIGVLYTKLLHEEGIPLYIPNSIVSQALILNYHRARERKLRVQFDLDISIPYRLVQKVVASVMKKHRITGYTIDIDYLHTNIYVVSVHFGLMNVNIKRLRSDILTGLVGAISRTKKHAR